MRGLQIGLKQRLGRFLVVVSVVGLLAVPAEAKPRDGGWVPKIVVKMLKQLGIATNGDMITIPRP